MFDTLAVIGPGLIGGSLALAAKSAGLVQQVQGYSRRPETAQQAQALGVLDKACASIQEAVQGADAVFIAVPVAQYETVLRAVLPYLDSDALVFDGGSTKGDVAALVDKLTPEFPSIASQFVLAHPIAGAERHGPSAATADLYVGRTVVVCEGTGASDTRFESVCALWSGVGALVKVMNAAEHDRVFAAVSHLPHWLAYAYVDAQLSQPNGREVMQEGGGGFRDFTRIAASSPEMWTDIFFANRSAMLEQLDALEKSLAHMREALVKNDATALRETLARSAEFRSNWKGR